MYNNIVARKKPDGGLRPMGKGQPIKEGTRVRIDFDHGRAIVGTVLGYVVIDGELMANIETRCTGAVIPFDPAHLVVCADTKRYMQG